MHNNLNILEMKQVQPFIPNANRLNIWQNFKQFKPSVKR